MLGLWTQHHAQIQSINPPIIIIDPKIVTIKQYTIAIHHPMKNAVCYLADKFEKKTIKP